MKAFFLFALLTANAFAGEKFDSYISYGLRNTNFTDTEFAAQHNTAATYAKVSYDNSNHHMAELNINAFDSIIGGITLEQSDLSNKTRQITGTIGYKGIGFSFERGGISGVISEKDGTDVILNKGQFETDYRYYSIFTIDKERYKKGLAYIDYRVPMLIGLYDSTSGVSGGTTKASNLLMDKGARFQTIGFLSENDKGLTAMMMDQDIPIQLDKGILRNEIQGGQFALYSSISGIFGLTKISASEKAKSDAKNLYSGKTFEMDDIFAISSTADLKLFAVWMKQTKNKMRMFINAGLQARVQLFFSEESFEDSDGIPVISSSKVEGEFIDVGLTNQFLYGPYIKIGASW